MSSLKTQFSVELVFTLLQMNRATKRISFWCKRRSYIAVLYAKW